MDVTSIEKIAFLRASGSNFRAAFPTNFDDKLVEIIQTNKDLRCVACGTINSTNSLLARLPSMDELFSNLEYVSQFSNKPGFDKIITLLKSGDNNRDGVNHMLSYMRNNEADFVNLAEFEYRYDDELMNTADLIVQSSNGKIIKYEFKSWTTGTNHPLSTGFAIRSVRNLESLISIQP